ncbi:hypothetical protein QX215_21985, partial [Chryseobacterium gambrini]|nr:hypothetical protein [Chryseobacterium gambrini]
AYFVILVIMGWISIYGASYDFDQTSILDWDQRAGKQFVWILTAFIIGGMLLLVDYRMYNFFAYNVPISIKSPPTVFKNNFYKTT